MNIENFEYLEKRLEKRGWEHLAPQLKENMTAGKPDFILNADGEVDGKQVAFESQFRKHGEHDFYYFNRINASLEQNGVLIAQASFRESWNLLPEEMYRILNYGSKVAVYKEGMKNDAGESFNAYITVNQDKPLDENGNVNLNTYHDNYYRKYPFDLDNALTRLPVPIRELTPENMDGIIRDLKSGIPVPVTMKHDGSEINGYLSINAKVGRVDVLDDKMRPVQFPKRQAQQTRNTQQGGSVTQSAQQVDEVKKKPWQNRQQRVDWNRRGKGMAR